MPQCYWQTTLCVHYRSSPPTAPRLLTSPLSDCLKAIYAVIKQMRLRKERGWRELKNKAQERGRCGRIAPHFLRHSKSHLNVNVLAVAKLTRYDACKHAR